MIVDDRRVIVRVASFILFNTVMTFSFSRWDQPTLMIEVRRCLMLRFSAYNWVWLMRELQGRWRL